MIAEAQSEQARTVLPASGTSGYGAVGVGHGHTR